LPRQAGADRIGHEIEGTTPRKIDESQQPWVLLRSDARVCGLSDVGYRAGEEICEHQLNGTTLGQPTEFPRVVEFTEERR
jgi:hypothetical protein